MTGSRTVLIGGIIIVLVLFIVLINGAMHPDNNEDFTTVTTPDGQTFQRPTSPPDTFTPPTTPPPGDDIQPAPEEPPMKACTMDAKQCPDGSYVGRVGPGCAFAACPSGGQSPVDDAQTYCDPDARPEMCAEIYQPVCAMVQVQCVTTPCPPLPETRSNACSACADQNVVSYTEGSCAQ